MWSGMAAMDSFRMAVDSLKMIVDSQEQEADRMARVTLWFQQQEQCVDSENGLI